MIPPRQQIVLGTERLGLDGSREDAYRLLDTFVDLGGAVIDTAAVYNDWVPGEVRRAEAIIGEWRRSRGRGDIFVCTKGAHPSLSDMATPRLDPASIVADVDASLERLHVQRLDLFYLHRDDPARPVEAILEPLARLREAGKIAALGLSNWTAARIAQARASGVVPVASNQLLGNILCRHMSPPPDPTIVVLGGAALHDGDANDTSLFLFSSQCGGDLTKRLRDPESGRSEYRNAAATEAAERVIALARGLGVDPTHLAVRFLLDFSPRFFPVIGPRTSEQLRHSLEAAELRIDPETMAELAAISGFGEWR
jgi:aryl-alcohol dehydrogenase-like predicted oxidoreductase